MSSSSESDHEDDSSVGSRFVDEDMLSDDDVEAWMERPRRYMIVKKSFMDFFRRVKANDPALTKLKLSGLYDYFSAVTNDGWEQLGSAIANNSYLEELVVGVGVNLVDQKMTDLFRGLTRSNSMKRLTFVSGEGFFDGILGFDEIQRMVPFLQNCKSLVWLDVSEINIQCKGFQLLLHALRNSPIKRLDCDNCDLVSIEIEDDAFPKKLEWLSLHDNGFGVDGVRSLIPFLQNSNNLTSLTVDRTNITSEGFSLLFRALSNSPIKQLSCGSCGIESIEIDDVSIPTNLKCLSLYGNNINTDGCHQLAKLLQRKNAALEELGLGNNKIDDEGVAILADALQYNSTLERLRLDYNEGITIEGMKMLLKLVCDVSSIKATLQSNHTLQELELNYLSNVEHGEEFIQQQIELALGINKKNKDNPAAAGREKVIQTQLNSQKRSELCRQQGIDTCNAALFSEIKPLHLPEVLALISRHHGQGELYVALVSSIVALFSTVNKMQCLQQQRAYHEAMLEAINAEIAAIE